MPEGMSSTAALFPTALHAGQKFCLVLPHLPDECGSSGCLMRGGPQHQFRQHRRQANSLCGQKIDPAPPVRGIALCGDDSVGREFSQTIGEDVRRDGFI
jgi:hypothetical protein